MAASEIARPLPQPVPTSALGFDPQRLGTVTWDVPAIFVDAETLDAILEYSDRFPRREVGGFLMGGWHTDQKEYIHIRHFLPADETKSHYASLTFTHDTWAALHDQVEESYPNESILGWHHTHPGFGVFLSEHDLFIHRHFFSQPWQVALVVDPQQHQFSFFNWNGDRVQDAGFFCVRS